MIADKAEISRVLEETSDKRLLGSLALLKSCGKRRIILFANNWTRVLGKVERLTADRTKCFSKGSNI